MNARLFSGRCNVRFSDCQATSSFELVDVRHKRLTLYKRVHLIFNRDLIEEARALK